MSKPQWTTGTAKQLRKILDASRSCEVTNQKDQHLPKSKLNHYLLWHSHEASTNWRWKVVGDPPERIIVRIKQ